MLKHIFSANRQITKFIKLIDNWTNNGIVRRKQGHEALMNVEDRDNVIMKERREGGGDKHRKKPCIVYDVILSNTQALRGACAIKIRHPCRCVI